LEAFGNAMSANIAKNVIEVGDFSPKKVKRKV
jgi:hypothetical protein